MKRNISDLFGNVFDVLVIGAGIHGAWIALDAAQRGLRVALVDKGDFGAATSAATGRMIHGGIRYLQHLSFGRLTKSLHERMLLLRNAPHLVHPMPFLIPTFGHLMKGKEILSLAMHIYDLFANRAQAGAPYVMIPRHVRYSRDQILRLEPHLAPEGMTGGIGFTDCQMPYPERLTLAVSLRAREFGAVVVNYARACELLLDGKRVIGAQVEDLVNNMSGFIRAKYVVNATGPWLMELIPPLNERKQAQKRKTNLSKGIHIITRPLTNGHGLALATGHKHAGSLLDRGGRHFFIVPWEGMSLVGTTNVPFQGSLEQPLVTEADIQGLIEDVNSVYPSAGLSRKDVRHFYGGLYPDDPNQGEGYQGGRKDIIWDHAGRDGLLGLLSVTGVKYTTGRGLAAGIVDMICKELRHSAGCSTERTVVHGGNMPGYATYLESQRKEYAEKLEPQEITRLVRHYGTALPEVLKKFGPLDGNQRLDQQTIDHAQTIHAVHREMAHSLKDVVFRRTDIGLYGNPGRERLQRLAEVMAVELDWESRRIGQEIEAVEICYKTV